MLPLTEQQIGQKIIDLELRIRAQPTPVTIVKNLNVPNSLPHVTLRSFTPLEERDSLEKNKPKDDQIKKVEGSNDANQINKNPAVAGYPMQGETENSIVTEKQEKSTNTNNNNFLLNLPVIKEEANENNQNSLNLTTSERLDESSSEKRESTVHTLSVKESGRRNTKRKMDLDQAKIPGSEKLGGDKVRKVKTLTKKSGTEMTGSDQSDGSPEVTTSNSLNNNIKEKKITDFFDATSRRNIKKIDNKRSEPEIRGSGAGFILALSDNNRLVGKENATGLNQDSDEMKNLMLFEKENKRLKNEINTLNTLLTEKEDIFSKKDRMANQLKEENQRLNEKLVCTMNDQSSYKEKVKEVLCKVLLEKEKLKRDELKASLNSQRHKLGEFVSQRDGGKFVDVWVEGHDFKRLKERLNVIIFEKEELEKKKKNLKTKKTSGGNMASALQNQSIGKTPTITDLMMSSKVPSMMNSDYFRNYPDDISQNSNGEMNPVELKNRISFQISILQKEEQEIKDTLQKLGQEKTIYMQLYKSQYESDHCRFGKNEGAQTAWPLLHKRYQLLSLIGKGGFSEVYKAFDVEECREVACKIHQLNPNWPEHLKANYTKHALREFWIHRELSHPNIVKLHDYVEIDDNSFCTVLEYCEGPDLSFFLKKHKMLTEKEAKSLVWQIVSGIRYLQEFKTKVIHYDLKPQNILFHKGEIKISDFGLCKIMDEDSTRLELTSQGVGTYWYLPPECFLVGENPPKISPKVDVWSIGVIFFELLFGMKPFGHNMTQERVLQDKVMLKATNVNFPSKPILSNECKDFIKNCLAYNQEDRWDINTAFKCIYFQKK